MEWIEWLQWSSGRAFCYLKGITETCKRSYRFKNKIKENRGKDLKVISALFHKARINVDILALFCLRSFKTTIHETSLQIFRWKLHLCFLKGHSHFDSVFKKKKRHNRNKQPGKSSEYVALQYCNYKFHTVILTLLKLSSTSASCHCQLQITTYGNR